MIIGRFLAAMWSGLRDPEWAIGALIALPTAAIVQAFISTYLEHHEVIENVLAED